MRFEWTAAHIDEMKRLNALGWRALAIAAQLGTTKAAVNAKRHRLGLARPAGEVRANRQVEQKAIRGSFQFRKAKSPPETGEKKPSHFDLNEPWRTDGLRIMDESFGGCRWPIGGDGADTRFCCRPAAATYCQEHAARANTSSPAKADLKALHRLFKRAA